MDPTARSTVVALAQAVWTNNPLFQVVLLLLMANVLVSIAGAFKTGTFALQQLADWLRTMAVPYLLGGAAMNLVGMALPNDYGPAVVNVTWVFVIAALAGRIFTALRGMGLPVPAALSSGPECPTPAQQKVTEAITQNVTAALPSTTGIATELAPVIRDLVHTAIAAEFNRVVDAAKTAAPVPVSSPSTVVGS